MPKVLPSPVKRWPGTVTLAEPLTFPQYIAWRDAMAAAAAYVVAKGDTAKQAEYDELVLAGLRPSVEKWGLDSGFTPDPFPATPRLASSRLIAFLVAELSAIANEADEPDPNSSPPSTAGA